MSDQPPERPANSNRGYDIFTVWKEYEAVAIHFNEIILKLRFQALGGVAALSALIGVVLKATLMPEHLWPVLSVSFAVLCIFWVALAILDIFYYNRLLLGTVDAILRLEDESGAQQKYDRLELSTEIKRNVEGVGTKKWRASLRGPLAFYGLVLVALLGLFGLSVFEAITTPSTVPSSGAGSTPACAK